MTQPYDWSHSAVMQQAKAALEAYLPAELARRAALTSTTLPTPAAYYIALDDNVWLRQVVFPSITLVCSGDRREPTSGNEQKIDLDLIAIAAVGNAALTASTEEAMAIAVMEYCEAVGLVLADRLPRNQMTAGVRSAQVVGSVQSRALRHKNVGQWITARKIALTVSVRAPATLPP